MIDGLKIFFGLLVIMPIVLLGKLGECLCWVRDKAFDI